jgi:hypothetical protein
MQRKLRGLNDNVGPESLNAAEFTSKASSNSESASLGSNGFNNFTLCITKNQTISRLEANEGQLCLSDANASSKYKFSVMSALVHDNHVG